MPEPSLYEVHDESFMCVRRCQTHIMGMADRLKPGVPKDHVHMHMRGVSSMRNKHISKRRLTSPLTAADAW